MGNPVKTKFLLVISYIAGGNVSLMISKKIIHLLYDSTIAYWAFVPKKWKLLST